MLRIIDDCTTARLRDVGEPLAIYHSLTATVALVRRTRGGYGVYDVSRSSGDCTRPTYATGYDAARKEYRARIDRDLAENSQ